MLIESRPIKLTTRTGVEVRRTIPHAKLKMIGAWCFADHFGPTEQTEGMVVAAHPHTGLQTVTWLFEGQIEHRDSIGSIQIIDPGQLNLMTAGHGISHSELSLKGPKFLHAIQLWVALPESVIDIAPAFEHQSELPVAEGPGLVAKVLIGEFMNAVSPTTSYSDLLGVELTLDAGSYEIPLNNEFEHGFILIEGQATIENDELPLSGLKFFDKGADKAKVFTTTPARLMLLGGRPFEEPIVMWWNFIARSQEQISMARQQWNDRDARFGEFQDNIGGWIPAPELPNVALKPR